jgi:DNA-binding NtrC family response regulator
MVAAEKKSKRKNKPVIFNPLPPKYTGSILLVEDEDTTRNFLAKALQHFMQQVTLYEAKDYWEGMECARNNHIDLCITGCNFDDWRLGAKKERRDGMHLLRDLKQLDPSIDVIMLTGYCTVECAVEAMRLGAFHYACKSINLDELYVLINRVFEARRQICEAEVVPFPNQFQAMLRTRLKIGRPMDLHKNMEAWRQEIIKIALQAHGNNHEAVAKQLNLSLDEVGYSL